MNRLDKELEKIALDCLNIETLEQRYSDELDFHDVSVWGIKEALKRAYELGEKRGCKKINKGENV